MKKIFTLMAVVLMAVTSAKAQFELGGVVGGMYGVSAKYWFSEKLALQGDLAVGLTQAAGSMRYKETYEGQSYTSDPVNFSNGMYDFTLNPNVLYHFELPENFKLYTGGGMSLGLLSNIENTASEGILGKFGLNAVVGATYDLQSFPLVFALDFRPGYGLGFTGNKSVPGEDYSYSTTYNYFDWKLAFAVRYRF